MNTAVAELEAPPTEDRPAAEWKQAANDEHDTWHLDRYSTAKRGYVSQYTNGCGYNWQAYRGDHCLSGSAPDRDAAMAAAEATLALPVDEFNARVLAKLTEELFELEKQILDVAPSSQLLPGYHAGYEAGVAAIRSRIEEALQ